MGEGVLVAESSVHPPSQPAICPSGHHYELDRHQPPQLDSAVHRGDRQMDRNVNAYGTFAVATGPCSNQTFFIHTGEVGRLLISCFRRISVYTSRDISFSLV